MKKMGMLFVFIFLVACQSNTDTDTAIEWADFVKLNGTKYVAAASIVMTDDTSIGKEAGQVDFTLDDNVTDTDYKAKDGDAAYLKKGTKLFHVQDEADLLAVPDDKEINGYKIYLAKDSERNQSYAELDTDSIDEVEIYEGSNEPTQLNKLVGEEQIDTLTDLLHEGKQDLDFSPETSKEDPTVYHMVFYKEDSPIAYRYLLHYDGEVWYWNQNETQIIPDEIGEVILAP